MKKWPLALMASALSLALLQGANAASMPAVEAKTAWLLALNIWPLRLGLISSNGRQRH